MAQEEPVEGRLDSQHSADQRVGAGGGRIDLPRSAHHRVQCDVFSRVVRSVRVKRTLCAHALVREENLDTRNSFRARERRPQVRRCDGRGGPSSSRSREEDFGAESVPCRLHSAPRHLGRILRHQVSIRLGGLWDSLSVEPRHASRASNPHVLGSARLRRHLVSVGQSEVEAEKVVVTHQTVKRAQLAPNGSSLTRGAISFFEFERTKNLPPRLKFVRISVNLNPSKKNLFPFCLSEAKLQNAIPPI